jgi:hypothetical protein
LPDLPNGFESHLRQGKNLGFGKPQGCYRQDIEQGCEIIVLDHLVFGKMADGPGRANSRGNGA